jgi:DICT domain-containing protein
MQALIRNNACLHIWGENLSMLLKSQNLLNQVGVNIRLGRERPACDSADRTL